MDLNELLKDPEQIKGLITVLQALVDSQKVESTIDKEPTAKKTKTTKKKKQNTAKAKKSVDSDNHKNRFLDMPEMNLHKEDVEIDKKLHKFPPTPRTRRFQNVKVVCRVCGKSESINPSYITMEKDRYKCNKCSGAAG